MRRFVIAAYYGHDASLALVGEGHIWHLEKERFTREKHDSGDIKFLYPILLKQAQVHPEEIIAAVGIGCGDHFNSRWSIAAWTSLMNIHQDTTGYFGPTMPCYFIPHHLAHAAYAFYTSPFSLARIIVMDGAGDAFEWPHQRMPIDCAVGEGRGNLLTIHCEPFQGIGKSWDMLAQELFQDSFAAGSVMALVGIPKDMFCQYTGFSLSIYDRVQRLQALTTERFLALADRADNLCVSGRCALNGISMYALENRGQRYAAVHVPPAVHDGGLPVGAALFILHTIYKQERIFYPSSAIAFAGYQDSSIIGELSISAIVERLADGKILGICVDRAESGPRALGHRSIIADVRKVTHDQLNHIKQRQSFRPVAPALTPAMARRYFQWHQAESAYRYMTFIVPATQYDFPSGVHYDRTARIQIVPDATPLGNVINTLGAPILHTSFNARGEAIVNTAMEAEQTAQRIGIDAVVLGNRIKDF